VGLTFGPFWTGSEMGLFIFGFFCAFAILDKFLAILVFFVLLRLLCFCDSIYTLTLKKTYVDTPMA
jgi:hypothetical protein